MDQVAAILGVYLPSLKARTAIMQIPCIASHRGCSQMWGNHRDSMQLIKQENHNTDDDETASTLSASDSDLSFSGSIVTFADVVVTEVHLRPYTTMEEKYSLYYNDYDYSEFRRECFSGKRRNRRVRFADSVVSDVHIISVTENTAQMFYTESELQNFLDEFVASLDKGFGFD